MNDLQSPSGRLQLRPLEGLLLGLVAGLIVWSVVQALHPLFRVSKEFDVPSIGTPTEKFLEYQAEKDRRDRWHVALYLGALGLLTGLALGGREATLRRSPLPLLAVPPLGTLGGAAGGMLSCLLLLRAPTELPADLKQTIFGQCAAAMPLGLGIGLGLGLSVRSFRGVIECTLAGLGAGAVAAVAYVVGMSLFVPDVNTSEAFPSEWSARLIWFGLPAGLIGLIIPLAGRPKGRAANTPPTTVQPAE